MARNEKSLEQQMEELESILRSLEDSDTDLEHSFRLYEQGMKLLKSCNASIDKIEKKMIVLNENGEENEV